MLAEEYPGNEPVINCRERRRGLFLRVQRRGHALPDLYAGRLEIEAAPAAQRKFQSPTAIGIPRRYARQLRRGGPNDAAANGRLNATRWLPWLVSVRGNKVNLQS